MSETDGTPPAAAPETPPAASFVNADGTFSENWHTALGDDFKDDAPTLSRYKSVQDLSI